MANIAKNSKISVECAGIGIPFEGTVVLSEESFILFRGSKLPVLSEGTDLKIKFIDSNNHPTIYHGNIYTSNETEWEIDNIEYWDIWERRKFYRHSVSVDAVVRDSNNVLKIHGKVLNISASGLRLSCENTDFNVGDFIYVTDIAIVEGKPKFYFCCNIVRKEEHSGCQFYGCAFVGLSEKEQDELIGVINILQRKDRKKQINRGT